jgi:hypothetical protein
MIKFFFRSVLVALAALVSQATASAQTYAIISYESAFRSIEGEQPFTYSYQVSATAFFDVGTPLVLPLKVISLSRPAGVSEATALSFVSLNVPSLTFGADGQTRPFTIFIDVPAGQRTGDYGYVVKVDPSFWPTNLQTFDDGSFINMEVTDGQVTALPPAILITSPADLGTFTYTPANGPLLIPYTFAAAATDSTPILSVDADLNSVTVPVTATGLNSTSVSGSGTLSITAGGLYTLRARASNGSATATDSVEFTVLVDAPLPTVTPTQPLNNAVYNLTLGQTVQIPVGFTANSLFGTISSVSATLNGTPINGLTANGIGSSQATGTASIGVFTPGSYTLVYTAANALGSASATVNFTVQGIAPPPVVTIATPTVGTIVNRVTGDAPSAVPFAFNATSSFAPIQSLSVTLNGTPVTATLTGLSSSAAGGTGQFAVSAPGIYTMVATASNGDAVASATRTFTVVETTPPPVYNLTWLPPVSTGVSVEGGVTVPVKFTLTTPAGATITDQNVILAIYEVFPNGTSSAPVLYPYGTSGPAAPDYAISGGVYQLDFPTAAGAHTYKVEVYSASTANALLLGVNQFSTFAAPEPEGCCGDEIMVRHMPAINGTVNGSIRVLLPESVTLNGGAVITGSLLVPGTPSVTINGKPAFGGTLEGSGAPSPTNHRVTLNGNATLGNLVRKTDALVMPVVPAPANPTGTQSIVVNSTSQAITGWSNVRNVTLNGNVGIRYVPAGSYGNFISNGINSGFELGVAGSTQPTVYEFQSLTLNGQTEIRLRGPVIIRVRNGFASNGILGSSANPSWLTLQVHTGGFTINGGSAFYGCVLAPNGSVTVNSNTIFKGGITADRLTVNGGANLLVAPTAP